MLDTPVGCITGRPVWSDHRKTPMTPSIIFMPQWYAHAYTDSASRTDFVRFQDRGHFICGQPGWETVAGYVEHWIQEQRSGGQTARKSAQPSDERNRSHS